jgi:hypothetical protein
VTRRVLTVLPPLAASPDAGALAGVLRGLASHRQRRAFVRTAHTVIDWRGQTVSATRQLGLLRDVPVLVAWGARDTTIPPHRHQSFAERVPHAVLVEIPDAGHYLHETAPDQLLAAMEAFLANTTPLSVFGDPRKGGSPLSFLSLVPRRRPGLGRWGRGRGSRWSARSAARTNDLDARRGSRRMLTVRGRRG